MILALAPELHCDAGASLNVSSCGRCLLTGHAAADRLQLESAILSDFKSSAYGLSDERWDLDSSLFDIQNHGASYRSARRVRL